MKTLAINVFTSLVMATLFGCGGGDAASGPDVISPQLSYKRVPIGPWDRLTLPPVFDGAYGQSVSCSLATAPKGFSIDSACNLTIDQADSGTQTVSISLAVKGYSGNKQVVQSFNVKSPTLLYNLQIAGLEPTVSKDDALLWLTLLTTTGGTPVLSDYTPLAGDSVAYKADGLLAPGMTLNSVSGILSGTPESSEQISSNIYAEIVRNGRSQKIAVKIITAMPRVSYSSVVATTLETSKTAKPNPIRSLPTDSIRYEIHNKTNTTGDCYGTSRMTLAANQIAIDATTGDVRPSFNTKGVYCIPVAMVITRQDKSHTDFSSAYFEIR
jgi:hypothetical protein